MPSTQTSNAFEGFHPETIAFFEGLALDNSKRYFDEHREIYETRVREPMRRLLASFEGVFGPLYMFRPNRDLRFTDDKRPYKESVAGTVGSGRGSDSIGTRYVHLTKDELFVAAGVYRMDRGTLKRYRQVVDDPQHGERLRAIVDDLAAAGYDVGGKELKVGPRDYSNDHPRIELLKHKGLTVARSYPVEDWLFTPAALDRVAAVWGDAEPLNRFLHDRLAGYAEERGRR